jgi:hypothetical protein
MARAIKRLWVFLFVVPMVLVAQVTSMHQVIFPEAAALSFGSLVMAKRDWLMPKWQLIAVPPVAAALGVGSVRLNISEPVAVPILLAIVVVGLRLLDSQLFPTVSAAVLPAVFRVRTPYFLLMVIGISVVLALMSNFVRPAEEQETAGAASKRSKAIWFYVLAMVWFWPAFTVLPVSAFAPPILVSAYEWINHSNKTWPVLVRQWLAVVLAAAVGEAAIHFLPVAAAGTLAVLFSMIFAEVLSIHHPPVLAISLLPLISPTTPALSFVTGIALAAAFLYLSGMLVPRGFAKFASRLGTYEKYWHQPT